MTGLAGDRAQALAHIVSLAREHRLTAGEIATALQEPDAAPEGRAKSVIVRVLGYLGGTFIFAGLAAFIALQWDGMNSAARVVITLGPGIAALAMAVIASRDERFDRAAAPLFLIAAALEPTGMLVAFSEYGSGGDARLAALVTAGVMGLQFAAVFGAIRRSIPLFLAVLFGVLFWWTAFDLLDVDSDLAALVIGGTLILSAIAVDRTPHAAITPIWYLVGAVAFLYGLFDLVDSTPLEILFLIAACGFVYLSAAIHSRTLLLVATAAILAYTAWFTGEHFANSLGWPLALMLFGLLMIGLSAAAYKIDRRYIRASG